MRKEIKLRTPEDVEKLALFAEKYQTGNAPITVCHNSIEVNALSILGILPLVGKENVFLVFSNDFEPKKMAKQLCRAGLA